MKDFLAAVSYPELSLADKLWIDAYRKQHDDYYNLIDVHISFIFPIEYFDPQLFITEMEKQVEGTKEIPFIVRCATRNNDLTSDYWHVLLVPDEGFSDIVKLHDKLYSGLLAPFERLDLDFVPHLGIGNTKKPGECKRLVCEINSMNILIKGVINKIQLIKHENGIIHTFHELKLK